MGSFQRALPPAPRPPPPTVTVDLYPDTGDGILRQSRDLLNSGINPQDTIRLPTPPAEDENHVSDSVESSDNNVDLGSLLRNLAVPHADGGSKQFWPSKLLKEVLTVDMITRELNRYAIAYPKVYKMERIPRLSIEINQECIVIFALLCLLSKGPCIKQCLDEGIKDCDLPLAYNRSDGYKLHRTATPTQPIQSFERSNIPGFSWMPHERDCIIQYQGSFNPIVFGLDDNGHASHVDFATEVILPFMQSQSSRATQYGGFAVVDQVEIHPYCHQFHGLSSVRQLRLSKKNSADQKFQIETKNRFAMKRFEPRNGVTEKKREQNFKQEVAMLNRFAHLKHDHLVRLLASWTRPRNSMQEHCLLFPLARCDLDLYMEQQSLADTTICWIAKQILGLTDALRKIHDPPSDALMPEDQRKFGRHGDLKPENILWYHSTCDQHGILVIADLGASAVNSLWSRSGIENRSIQHTPRYKPPECDLEGGRISRSYDIWTFGCILLEMVCWCLQGSAGRVTFGEERFALYPTGSQTDMYFDIKPAPNGRFVVLVKEGVTEVSMIFLIA